MAEIPMGAPVSSRTPKDTSQSAALLVNRAGLIVSAALVVGTCVWGYQVLSRDVSGVPVVRALEGPMRIQPDDPGGRAAGHQGLMVNEVAADGSAAGPTDQVVVAPPPMSLTEQDIVRGDAAAVQDSAAKEGETPALRAPQADVAVTTLASAEVGPIVAPQPLDVSSPLSVEELADQLSAGAQPLSPLEDQDVAPAQAFSSVQEAEDAPAAAGAPHPVVGGLKRSLRPVLRPATLASPANGEQVAAIDAAIGSALKSIEAEDVPPGTRLVQLGAYESAEIAEREWGRLQARFQPYLGDKTRVIQKASSGGRVFYRLRAMGFDTVSDARRLCSALKAENADCIPVTTR